MSDTSLIPGHRDGVQTTGVRPPDARATEARDEEHGPAAPYRRFSPAARPLLGPAAVAAVLTLLQLVLVVPGLGLGWDETVYVSQVGQQAPAAFFSAPRARGITFLVAPVVALTDSTDALRVYLSLLSGCGLFLALRVWRRLLPASVLTVAGALFAGLWITLFYGPQAMPNLWVAYGALATVGCFLRVVRDPGDRRAQAGIGAGVALVALMRPTDAAWLVLPLAAAVLLPPARVRHRARVLAILAAGAALGSAEWIAEAYVRYGGLLARLDRASEIQGHLGLYHAVDDHVRALAGHKLCRPCDIPWERQETAIWFFVLPLLVAGGTWAAARTRYRAETVLATVVGLCLAAPYLFTVGYAAPRFLLPAYALLFLPVARCLLELCRTRPRWRRTGAVVVVLAVAGHLSVQYSVLTDAVEHVRARTVTYTRIAAELHAQGVRPPCVVTGKDAVRVAYRTGCASRQPGGPDASTTRAELRETARRQPVVVLVPGGHRPPSYARTWRALPLPGHERSGYHALLSPTAAP